MPTEQDADTSRAVVKTYVPAYQKSTWAKHADELGMSQSEFVRSMVQAGRRGFDASPQSSDGNGADSSDRRESNAGTSLEDQLRDVLSESAYLSWEELLSELTNDIEDRLEDALQSLQAADEVRYSGPNGGYTLSEEP